MSAGNTSNNIGTLRQWTSRLRKKIEKDPAFPNVIITHHRRGYSFAGKEEARWFPELEAA
jgi:DNA-binding response OmpR family regulator